MAIGEGGGVAPALWPLSLLLVEEGTVLSSLTIFPKEIFHRGASYFAGGLSAVVTPPNERGHGYGHRLVVEAREFMEDNGFDIGLFTCDRPLQRFYEAAGWSILIDCVLIGGIRSARLGSVCIRATSTACGNHDGLRRRINSTLVDRRLWLRFGLRTLCLSSFLVLWRRSNGAL